MRYQVTERFGWLNCFIAMACLPALQIIALRSGHSAESIIMALALQLLIGASMIYASRQKRAGSDIGDKAYPATLAAYVLFVLFIYRWLFGS